LCGREKRLVNKQERTYEILRDRIHSGVYPPKARLNIDALSRELGVSPIPVREALRRLEAQGWVQFKPNAGAIVSPVDATSWEQAMVALAVLEGAATAEAQRHLRASDFTRLRKIAAEILQKGENKYAFIHRSRYLLWALICQGLLNQDDLETLADQHGKSMAIAAEFTELLGRIATTRVRLLLSALMDDREYRDKVAEGNLSFLRTDRAFERCMEIAHSRWKWDHKKLV